MVTVVMMILIRVTIIRYSGLRAHGTDEGDGAGDGRDGGGDAEGKGGDDEADVRVMGEGDDDGDGWW